MSNEQDVFSFDLNESLYFGKGQEVSQMLSISLDPEISVQSFNEYVSIRGVIELYGEYERSHTDLEREDQSVELSDQQSYRYLEKVENEGEDLATFSHRFPVEISVPSYRVNDLNDITVNVSTFDYEISDDNQLKLFSTIEIHGVSNEAVLPDNFNKRIEDTDTSSEEEELDDTFQFELKEELLQARESEEEEEQEQESEVVESRETISEEVELEAPESEETAEKDRWKYKQTQSLEEFFKKDESEQSEEIVHAEADENMSADTDAEEDPEPDRKVSNLAAFFAGEESDEEVKYEQMRICIVQADDTLETISERYEIPKLQLLKLNRLAGDDLTEGQLLTIPAKKK